MQCQSLKDSQCHMPYDVQIQQEGESQMPFFRSNATSPLYLIPQSSCLRPLLMRRDVTDHLQLLLRKAGHYLHTSAEKEVVRTIKEKTCYLAMNPVKEEKDNGGAWEEFRLPDGKVIQVCLFFQASAVASSLSRHHLLCIPRTPKLISARRREIFSPRDNVQSRIDRTRIPRCSSSHCRLDQQGRFRFEEIAVWKYRLIGRINTVYRSVITLLCCLYH